MDTGSNSGEDRGEGVIDPGILVMVITFEQNRCCRDASKKCVSRVRLAF